jgi:hypothetical protein
LGEGAVTKPWERYSQPSGPWDNYQPTTATAPVWNKVPVIKEPEGNALDFFGGSAEDAATVVTQAAQGLIGAADILTAGIQSGAAEIVSGYLGAVALIGSGGNINKAADWQRQSYDALSRGFITESAQEIIEPAVPALSRADVAINDFFEEHSDSPLEAAMMKATFYVALEGVGVGGKVGKEAFKARKVERMRQEIQGEAAKLGIKIDLADFENDLIRAANDLGSPHAGADAASYVQALRNAEYIAKLKKNSKYMEWKMRADQVRMETGPLVTLHDDLLENLDFDFDLDADDMVGVRKAIDDLAELAIQDGPITGRQIERYRNHLSAGIKKGTDVNGKLDTSATALVRVKKHLDNLLTSEYNNAMMGRPSTISGDIEALDLWRDARDLNKQYKWFNEDKIIRDLINKDTTSEQYAQWIFGSSANGSKRGAAAAVNRIKSVVGEDSVEFQALRADFMYMLTEPLITPEPNLKRFVNTYNNVIHKNQSLMSAFGMTESDAQLLFDFAQTAQKLPPGGKFYSPREVTQAISQLMLGHEVAKGSARVKLGTKILNMLSAQDQITKTEIIDDIIRTRLNKDELGGQRWGYDNTQPLIVRHSKAGAYITAAAALSNLTEKSADVYTPPDYPLPTLSEEE